MTTITISSGVSIFGGEVTSGDVLYVLSGGTVSNITVNFGGQLDLHGGRGGGALIDSGGIETVSFGGLALGTEVISGGAEIVSFGGVATSATIMAGGVQTIYDDGYAFDTVVNPLGLLTVYQSGHASGVHVLEDGQEFVSSGGADIDCLLDGQMVVVGGVASGTTVDSGAALIIGLQGSAKSTTVESGGDVQVGNGGTLEFATVSGGFAVVLSGGQASGLLVELPALLNIASGAWVVDATILGVADVGAGAVLMSASVGSGGDIEVMGVTSSTAVRVGGEEDVFVDGSADGATVSSGGVQVVFNQGGAHATTVLSGGVQIVSVGGFALTDLIQSGGFVLAGRRGRVSEAGVHAGGLLAVSGSALLDTLFGGSEVVFSGGVALSETIESGGSLQISSGGVASVSVISSGGQQVVFSGGVDVQTLIFSGGLEGLAGGSASGASVGSGGILRISSGGVASATKVFHGGQVGVFSGGVALGTVLSGGHEFDYGVTSGTQLASGGQEVVEAHGTASAEVVGSGAVLTVSSGGALAGGLKLWGGKAVISGTVAAGQTVAFAGASEVLELDNLSGFSAKISGLKTANQKIDLGGFTFSGGESVSWTQSGTSGTLTVKDGAKVAHLTLIGTYTSSSFHLSNDSHGGTFVADPPAHPAAAGFVQAIAALAQDFTAYVHSGGESVVITSPGFLTAATSGQ